MAEPLPSPPARCAHCAADLPPLLLACPACGALVHAAELKQLAATAAERTAAGDRAAALSAWRRAVELLPPGTRQHAEVTARITTLSHEVAAAPASPAAPASAGSTPARNRRGIVAGIGAAALAILSKGKLLLLGLTKLSTLGSMAIAFGVYLSLWGWQFALGFVLSLYVHEMGHVIALRRYGIAASAPMFIPGIGALVRLKQHPATVVEDAQVGLAGPIWGFGAAVVCFILARVTGNPLFLALAKFGGYINLFNLMPLGPLDGGRAFNALTKPERLVATAALGAALYLSHEPILWLLLLVAAGRAFASRAPARPSWAITLEYVALVAALTGLAAMPVPNMR